MSDIKFRAWDLEEKKMYPIAYQKVFHILLCEEDGNKGKPVKRAAYEACELMQGTTFEDKNGKEIFEGDKIRIKIGAREIVGIVEMVPDMFKSRKIHPLQSVLEKNGIEKAPDNLEVEIIGNRYES